MSQTGEKTCIFRNEAGEYIELPFSAVIDKMDAGGFLKLEDGDWVRRCVQKELERDGKQKVVRCEEVKHSINLTMVSDALGFGDHQLADFERDRVANHFHGIEFVRDPTFDRFIQVKCNCPKTYERYMKHRRLIDNNPQTGQLISRAELERAGQIVKDRYDVVE